MTPPVGGLELDQRACPWGLFWVYKTLSLSSLAMQGCWSYSKEQLLWAAGFISNRTNGLTGKNGENAKQPENTGSWLCTMWSCSHANRLIPMSNLPTNWRAGPDPSPVPRMKIVPRHLLFASAAVTYRDAELFPFGEQSGSKPLFWVFRDLRDIIFVLHSTVWELY